MEECLEIAKKRAGRGNITIKKKYRILNRVLVEADSLQIKELFGNILNNAFDAIEDSSGAIVIAATRETGGSVRICFTDTGIGMDEQHLRQIHEPFFTTKAKGTGLGLTVSQQIVNMHGGKLEFASKPGKGTSVYVTLPIKQNTIL